MTTDFKPIRQFELMFNDDDLGIFEGTSAKKVISKCYLKLPQRHKRRPIILIAIEIVNNEYGQTWSYECSRTRSSEPKLVQIVDPISGNRHVETYEYEHKIELL